MNGVMSVEWLTKTMNMTNNPPISLDHIQNESINQINATIANSFSNYGVEVTYEHGSLPSGNSTKYARTVEFISVRPNEILIVNVPDGWTAAICEYNINKVYIGYQQVLNGGINNIVLKGTTYYIKMVVSKTNGKNIELTEIIGFTIFPVRMHEYNNIFNRICIPYKGKIKINSTTVEIENVGITYGSKGEFTQGITTSLNIENLAQPSNFFFVGFDAITKNFKIFGASELSNLSDIETINLYILMYAANNYTASIWTSVIVSDMFFMGGRDIYANINDGKSPRPSTGYENFTVSINTSLSGLSDANDTLNLQDDNVTYNDHGLICLPENYTENGKPTRLVIFCHGTTMRIDDNVHDFANHPPAANLVKLGYAVMDMNGIPFEVSNNTELHYGSPLVLQSYIKGYQYVINKYNLYDEIFICGTSMGGLSSNMLVQSGCFKVLAQASFCGVTDLFKQAWCKPWSDNQRKLISEKFGFTGQQPTFTSGYPTEEEIQYFKDNLDKTVMYNPIRKNCINWDDDIYDNFNNEEEERLYKSLIKFYPCPIKIWHCDNDSTVAPRYSWYYAEAIKNSGGIAIMRKFPSGGHNAWDNGETVEMTDIKGITFNTTASTYELYQWLKRFDK